MVHSAFILFCLKIFSNFSFDLFWPIDYLTAYYLISTYLWIFQFSLFLISSFIPFWFEKIICMISILNLLRSVLWPNKWSTLENVLSTFEKNVYFVVVVGWSVTLMSIRSNYSTVLVMSSVSLLIFDLIDFYIIESEILKSLPLLCYSLFINSLLSIFVSYIWMLCC